jgi:hypothetical protein
MSALSRSLKPILGAGMVAAVLLIAGSWLHDRFFTAPSVILGGSQLSVLRGDWKLLPQGLAVGNKSMRQAVMIGGAVELLPASKYDTVTWDIENLDGAREVAINWVTTAGGGATHSRLLTDDEMARGRVLMSADARWRGDLLGIGLAADLDAGRAMIVRRFELVGRSGAPSVGESFSSLLDRWRYSDGWSVKSTNAYVGVIDGVRLSPVGLVAVWMMLTVLILMARRPVDLPLRSVAIVTFLLGWFLLDVRWQRELWLRSSSEPQRSRLLLSSGQASAIDTLVRQIPDRVARIFVVRSSAQPTLDLTLRYHLAPHSVYVRLVNVPSPLMVRAGDYVLIMGADQGVVFDPVRAVLFAGSEEIRADLIGASPMAGRLFRVRAGG